MTDGSAGVPTPVTVIRQRAVRAAGRRLGDAVVYDWGWHADGRRFQQRSFVLLEHGVQVNQPVGFPEQQRGWWYCDLVSVLDEGHTLHVDDQWIDVIVGPPDQPYRLLDLDEYAEAMAAGEMTTLAALDGLVRTQRFLDHCLNRRHEVEPSWPDFPPRSIEPLRDLDFPADWCTLS